MGMDASVHIWVGIKLGDDDEGGISLPDNFCPELKENGEIDYKGVCIQQIYCSDEVVGIGSVVFYHDWDYGTVEFDHEKINTEIKDRLVKVERFFKARKVNTIPKVYVNTDFS